MKTAENSTDYSWLAKCRFGLDIHWTAQTVPRNGSPKPFQKAVADFDLGLSDEVLIERAVSVATQLYPRLEGTFFAHRIFRWPEKVPTFRPGYLAALRQFWQESQEGPVYFCGDYFAGPSTGGALYSGKECAERRLRGL